jgi:hypothetical protein
MNTTTPPMGAGWRALALGALAAVTVAAVLTLGADPAQAAYTARVQAGTLKITGDAADDTLALRLGSPSTLEVDVGEDGSAGTERLLGGSGDDFVDGNIGADEAQLGAGDDRFQWDPGDGSDIVEGQGGHDQLDFNGSNIGEQIQLSANGARLLLTRNVANITMDMDGLEEVNVRALDGADAITVNDLAGTDARTVDVDFDAIGGTGDGLADTVIVNGTAGADKVKLGNEAGALVVDGLATETRVSGGETTLDNIVVAGLGGDDTLTATVGVTGTTPVTFDGGEGTDTTHFDGSNGDDEIAIARNGDAAATFAPGGVIVNTIASVESLVVEGRNGNDTIAGSNGLAPSPRSHSTGATETTRSGAPTAPTSWSAAAATTSSTATSAPTRRSSVLATTASSGTPATAATPSRARAATTSSTSTAPTSASRSSSRRTAHGCG